METEASLHAAFHPFSASHLAVLSVIVAFAATMITLARLRIFRVLRPMEIALGIGLILHWPFSIWLAYRYDMAGLANTLPLHLCGVAAFIGAYALFTFKREPCELIYFWGLAGTLQGLITPALRVDWPDPLFFAFFLLHGGVVTAALHVVFGRGITPRPWAVWRAFLWILVYAASVGLINAVLRRFDPWVNYGFLCEPPPTKSLIDYLGPWPWYVGSLVMLACVFFAVLDLPFVIQRRRARRK